HNQAPPTLLDTYESERREVAKQVLDNIAAQNALVPLNESQRALRALFRNLTALPEVEHHLSGMISGLNIKYPAEENHPAAGARLPDFPTAEGHASDLFHKGKFVLLTKEPTQPPHTEVVVAEVPRLPWQDVT